MKKLISISFIFGFLKFCLCAERTVPVLMMDHDAIMSRMTLDPNPFQKMSSDLFLDIALNAVKRTECVIIFIEETLCSEDLSTKDKMGTPFYNMQKGIADKKVVYMPSVVEPFDLLQQVFEPQPSNTFYLGSGEKMRVLKQHKCIFVYFKDEEKNRVKKLRMHDALMKEVYFTVRQVKAAPILAFYTGKKNPIPVQVKYSPEINWAPQKERGVMVATKDVLFRLTGIFSSTETRRSSFEETPVVEFAFRTRDALTTTMLVTDFHLQFNFEFGNDNWKLANVALLEAGEEVGRAETGVTAPWQRSYYCAEPITIFNMRDGSSITISEYQIEPLHAMETGSVYEGSPNETNANNSLYTHKHRRSDDEPGYCSFSKALNCGPYFNTAILSGLFVFSIFTVITFWGVIMLFNCHTNDRYDDPNQKPIVIAHEHGY